ncbi:MAG: exosome complex RNA-binding protein Rrp4 [Thaumarchaeota archaeon]|nr:exosome complex RNA-binding protein Rrp4 [Nitrososphaerota archaeon]MDD9813814.1 exosome complex RNA-binding protein Rrp4 [Nitrososphaerota archaeon]MDD9826632.1 exosome complex RNA-binding protein Rrp4 [Nitrososphaerota archaeon]MDD9842818.1 exosome complex RNA-binding protein Rrp4 [Nitrososphaerota archaeon]
MTHQGMPRTVMPGDTITREARRAGDNVVLVGDTLVSSAVGLVSVSDDTVSVIPLSGKYMPRADDLVVGMVISHTSQAWELDINAPYVGFLLATDVFGRDFASHADELTSKLALGDLVAARVANFDRTRDPLITIDDRDLGKIDSGELVKIAPGKVSSLIGRQGSMIQAIETATDAAITIGQNGWVVVSCDSADGLLRAKRAVSAIEQGAHSQGLMDRVKSALARGGD